MEHQTHLGICRQFEQVCWDSQRLSWSRCEETNTKNCTTRKRKTVVHRVIISSLMPPHFWRGSRYTKVWDPKGYCGIPRKWFWDKTYHNASLANNLCSFPIIVKWFLVSATSWSNQCEIISSIFSFNFAEILR